MRSRWLISGGVVGLLLAALGGPATGAEADRLGYGSWEIFTDEDGLPDNRVNCVCVTQDAVWVGTANGAARFAGGQWTRYSTADGLGDPLVTSIAQHKASGDVWIATLGGLTRYSAGRLTHYNQFNSGLSNNVVYGVAAGRGGIWVATSVGCSRYDLSRDEWTLFDQSNAPMREVLCDGIAATDERIVVAVWGGGVLEYRFDRRRWRSYADPDDDPVTDLLADDGLIHNVVTAAVIDQAGRLWAGTPFGLSCFDGRRWRSFRSDDSPLVCDRVNCLTARGPFVWIGTDDGLCATDGKRWFIYRREAIGDTGVAAAAPDSTVRYVPLPATFPHETINDIAFDGDDIWVATEGGLARGRAGEVVQHAKLADSDRTPSPATERLTPTQAIPLRHYSDPFGRFYERLVPFAGRRRPAPTPHETTIKLGFIAPLAAGPLPSARDPQIAIGRETLDGVRLALAEANETGGYQGQPFELVTRDDRGLWSSAANEVVTLARKHGVVAVLGSLDGAASLAIVQVAGRLRLPVVNTAATDPALTETGSPWLIRNMADDRQQAYALAHHIYDECGIELAAGMRSDDRFGHRGLAAFREASDRLGHPLRASLRWAVGQENFSAAIDRIAAGALPVVIWGPATDAARIVRQMRARDLRVKVFGCDRLASDAFLESAGAAAEGVTAVATYDPASPQKPAATFRQAFSAKFGYQPGTFAAHAYDGARMLLDCIRRVGPDPVRIRDALAGTASYQGVVGKTRFDTTLNAVGGLYVAEVSNGRFTYRPLDLAAMPVNTAERVLDRELARHGSEPPGEVGLHSRRHDFSIGCFWPLDARGRRVLRGAELAVMEDQARYPQGPPVSLHAHDARGDWGTQCSALVDLVREDEVLAILGSTEPRGTELLLALAARTHLPIVALHRETPKGADQEAGWLFRAAPAGRNAGSFAERYKLTFGEPPDDASLIGYVGARNVIEAIRGGARTRAALRAALAESPGSAGGSGRPARPEPPARRSRKEEGNHD